MWRRFSYDNHHFILIYDRTASTTKKLLKGALPKGQNIKLMCRFFEIMYEIGCLFHLFMVESCGEFSFE